MADDLNAEKTPGFKVGEKKTVDEYQKLGKRSHSRGRGMSDERKHGRASTCSMCGGMV